ncbi:hypothetical protein ABEB36_013586 [Hypothenemus hampei]|uniref:THAP-type domain-containing protein n=1 Tax=Hypothenemus hampei TaxID=57062 RepID=A0ABD1E4P9_HYPHA
MGKAGRYCIVSDSKWNTEGSLPKSYQICSAHFNPQSFLNYLCNRLKPSATPSKFNKIPINVLDHHNYTRSICSFENSSNVMAAEMASPNMKPIDANDDITTKHNTDVASSKITILQDIVITPDKAFCIDIQENTNMTPPSTSSFSPGSSQTDASLSASSPRKQRMRNIIKRLKRENEKLRKENEKLKQASSSHQHLLLSEIQTGINIQLAHCQKMAKFINTQLDLVGKKAQGRRYSSQFKYECLSLYFAGPKLYKTKLREQFCLPTPTTLMKMVQTLDLNPGPVNPQLLKMLREKVQCFSAEDRYCTICFDEMSIKLALKKMDLLEVSE